MIHNSAKLREPSKEEGIISSTDLKSVCSEEVITNLRPETYTQSLLNVPNGDLVAVKINALNVQTNGQAWSNIIKKWEKTFCHRSGVYISKGKGLRHLKTQGSNKIDGYCPDEIKVFVSETGACSIKFCKTHLGHRNDIGHVSLRDFERQHTATKIASKIPFDEILDEIRDSVTDSKLERIHLLTKKDLYNIENCFNIGSNAIKHKDDGTSVDAWVNEIESKNDSCILFYKPQGVTSAMHPELKSDDFVLIIMNDAQCEMLKKYVSHICIDGTHRTNGYDFELITLLILDDMRQGFPCSFFISNQTDHFVLEIFFAKIKEKVGEICPTVFMSDMAESFFNTWCNTFQSKPKHRLFCTWHVDRAWRKNLHKIQSREMRKKCKTFDSRFGRCGDMTSIPNWSDMTDSSVQPAATTTGLGASPSRVTTGDKLIAEKSDLFREAIRARNVYAAWARKLTNARPNDPKLQEFHQEVTKAGESVNSLLTQLDVPLFRIPASEKELDKILLRLKNKPIDPPTVKNQEAKKAAVPPSPPPLPVREKRRENEASTLTASLPPKQLVRKARSPRLSPPPSPTPPFRDFC
ncbi:uncharacterized protein TNCV_2917461 [Trichonephila clavipes]|nr:uncharacterized protein TNCV_2917461 [Trichonephila clavipes]